MDLLKGELNYTGPIDLPQYYVEKYAIEDRYKSSDMSDDQLGVRVEIVLGRRLINQLLTTFLPTTCICMVAFATNFFRVRLNIVPGDGINFNDSESATGCDVGIGGGLPKFQLNRFTFQGRGCL